MDSNTMGEIHVGLAWKAERSLQIQCIPSLIILQFSISFSISSFVPRLIHAFCFRPSIVIRHVKPH